MSGIRPSNRGRLLYVVPDSRFFYTHRMPLALQAKRHGYEVHVATPQGDCVPRIVQSGLQWHAVRFGSIRKKPWVDLLTLLDLSTLYRKLRPSLVHHVTFKAVLYGTIAARLNGTPAVVNAMTGLGEAFASQTFADRFWRKVTTVLFRLFVNHPRMAIVLQNEDDLRLLREKKLIGRKQATVIRGSGVDPTWYAPSATRRERSTETVVFTGRLTETKGLGDLAEAARTLRNRGRSTRFVVAGPRDPLNAKEIPNRLIDGWTRDGLIEYAGLVEDVRPTLHLADVFCLPSWGGEGVPKSLIEAASCGVPIVTTDVPGCRDIVRDGENGILVPPRRPEAIAAALETLLENPELRRDMGRRGREIVIEGFTLERVVRETLGLYCGLIR